MASLRLLLGGLSAVATLVATACPVAIPVDETIRFSCRSDDECPAGQRCSGQTCLAPGALVDASTADATGRDRAAADAAGRDGGLLDSTPGDVVRADTASNDGVEPDAAPIDRAMTDATPVDAPVNDTLANDAFANDAAAPDRWQPDAARPDQFSPDAAVPSVVRAHRTGSANLNDAQTAITVGLTSAVDPARSILVFSTTTNSNAPINGHVGGQLVNNGSAVRFQRGAAATGVAADIAWTVVELDGIAVQRGTESAPAGTLVTDATLASAVDLGRAFPLFSYSLGGGSYNDNDWREASFIDDRTLHFERVQSNDPGAIDWQVVEFLASSSGGVRTGSATMSSGDQTILPGLAPATDPAHAFLVFSYQLSGTGTLASQLVSGRIESTTQLRFERATSGVGIYITWYLIEWDAMRAQQGMASFSSGQQDRSATLDPSVDPGRSIAFCPSYQRQGETDYTADDVIGAGWFTTRVTGASNLAVHRASALGSARVDWTVVEFR